MWIVRVRKYVKVHLSYNHLPHRITDTIHINSHHTTILHFFVNFLHLITPNVAFVINFHTLHETLSYLR